LNAEESEKTPPLLALVPATVQKGDVICILYGCSVPVVLRRRAANPTTNGFSRLRLTQPTPSEPGSIRRLPRLQNPNTSTPIPENVNTSDPRFELPGSMPAVSSSTARTNGRVTVVEPDERVERFELLGECYVHGMMEGEAFKIRDDTKSLRFGRSGLFKEYDLTFGIIFTVPHHWCQ
jgi:hypothetical protein